LTEELEAVEDGTNLEKDLVTQLDEARRQGDEALAERRASELAAPKRRASPADDAYDQLEEDRKDAQNTRSLAMAIEFEGEDLQYGIQLAKGLESNLMKLKVPAKKQEKTP